MYFNSTTANFFKQCGIYDEFVTLGKYVTSIQMCNNKREVDFSINFAGQEETYVRDNGGIMERTYEETAYVFKD